ncbi:MAG: hypothetical protein K1X35_07470 [Caulobacteraceae bacterium]|nr:hypothetical protein [Caulobacteraceae bacterium]
MRRAVLLLTGALLLAGAAAAQDDSAAWRAREAAAADYNARTWVRLEAPDGGYLWVEANDAARLKAGKPTRRLRILWPDSVEYVPHVGEGVRYMVSEQTWDCGRKAMTEHNWFFGAEGGLMAERNPEPGEFSDDDLAYRVACQRLRLSESRRWTTVAAVLANEPDGGAPATGAPGE